jgi:hypothetical protein
MIPGLVAASENERGETLPAQTPSKRPPCKHILACLALARLDGYRLEVPR